MTLIRMAFLSLFLLGIAGGAEKGLKPFLPGDKLENWTLTEYSRWTVLPDGETGLEIRIPKDTPLRNITYGAYRHLDLRAYRGKQIVISATVSARDVPEQKEGFRCVKLMIYHQGETGNQYTTSSFNLWGTFENQRLELAFSVPPDVGKNMLMVGIQNNTGNLLFRGLKLEERDFYPAPVPIPENFRCEYSEAVRNAPRLRGAGLLSKSSLEDAKSLVENGANLARWWIRYDINDPSLASLNKTLDRLESFLPEYEKLNLKVIPVLQDVPGSRFTKPLLLGIDPASDKAKNESNFRLFFDRTHLEAYVRIWETIARRFKDSPVIYGYSVMNEPSQFGEVPFNYLYCQYLAAKAIRQIDPEKPIYIAANNWDKADAFAYLKPLPLRNIIYEVHMYTPYTYTHQGVGNSIEKVKRGEFQSYPGKIGDAQYNREALRKSLQPVVDFQKKYGAKIYCGEFSVIRWAPGGAQYLEDLCSIFEELSWDWAYHCHREWINWSFEHPETFGDDKPSKVPTARQKVLRKYWAKNKR